MPPAEQLEAWYEFSTHVIGTMNRSRVMCVRRALIEALGPEHEFIEVVDGHLALRDIRAQSDEP